MYVCICNAIRESEIRAVARRVTGGPDEVYAALGRTPQCRQCLGLAAAILQEERSPRLCPA